MIINLPSPLQDGALRLVPAGPNHASARYVGWLNDVDVVRHTEVVPGGHDLAGVRHYLEACLADPAGILFAMETAEAGHIGNLRLGGIDRRHGRATVALMIGEKAVWGRGFGSRAIGLASRYAFETLALRKLCAGIYSNNPASRQAFEKAGYACEATLVRHAKAGDAYVDVWQMARFRGD